MSAPRFLLHQTDEFAQILAELQNKPQFAGKLRKIYQALRLLEQIGPRHPGLNSHPFQSAKGPGGVQVWESYVENNTPSAWRMFWVYGPGPDERTIVSVGPHP